jgi:S-adenosylmethionine:tRNA ribosyltransferase-isomerase
MTSLAVCGVGIAPYTGAVKLEELDYELPRELIAERPAARRDESRLMTLDRATGRIGHRRFHELPDLLRPRDVIVVNDSRVIPARLAGRRVDTGGQWEGLFLREHTDGCWELLCQTRGTLRSGMDIAIGEDGFRLGLEGRTPDGHWRARPSRAAPALDLLQRYGQVPLPHYLRRSVPDAGDVERYQTVYADRPGSVAAPTAGLHFTPPLIERITAGGVAVVRVTLHVGLGTFQPIRAERIDEHAMHVEWGELTAAAATLLDQRRAMGGRIVAVGTTAVRVLESAACSGTLAAWSGETNLFIRPPFQFRAVDMLITNFHLPRTSLLALVYAFAGTEFARHAYRTAIGKRYRFYSFGDAMMIE